MPSHNWKTQSRVSSYSTLRTETSFNFWIFVHFIYQKGHITCPKHGPSQQKLWPVWAKLVFLLISLFFLCFFLMILTRTGSGDFLWAPRVMAKKTAKWTNEMKVPINPSGKQTEPSSWVFISLHKINITSFVDKWSDNYKDNGLIIWLLILSTVFIRTAFPNRNGTRSTPLIYQIKCKSNMWLIKAMIATPPRNLPCITSIPYAWMRYVCSPNPRAGSRCKARMTSFNSQHPRKLNQN